MLPAAQASAIPAARFDLPLGTPPVPEGLVAGARASAHAQGYAAGWAEGKRQAADDTRAATERAEAFAQRAAADWSGLLEQAVTAIGTAARGLEQRAAAPAADAEELLIRAAFTLAEALVGHDLAASKSPGEDAMQRALALAPLDRPVRVRLHPAAYAMITTGINKDPGARNRSAGGRSAGGGRAGGRGGGRIDERVVDGRVVRLMPDPMLEPGDAIAECDATTIDARLGAAVDRVRELLSGPGPAVAT
ncbi:MAG: flagellar assembly protein FliH [Mycobacteriales bacterium]